MTRGTVLPAHTWSWRHPAWPAYVRYLKTTDWPILVGPWHGEVGFEVLYWIPFLQHLIASGIPAARLIPITRGGAAVWYGTPTGLELYALRTPQQVRVENRLQGAKSGLLKQIRVTPFDRAILRDAAVRLGLGRYHVLHPAWMYHRLAPYWTGHRGSTWLAARTAYPPMPAPALPDGLILPPACVAVRFYSRPTWPLPQKLVQQATLATIHQLAEQSPVILLSGGGVTDDHHDATVAKIPNVLQLRDLTTLTPETNLAVQSAVIAHAAGFVGSYGGLAQLALRLGKPSVSFYLDWQGTAVAHKALSDLLALQFHVPFQVTRLAEIPLARSVLPQAVILQPPLPVGAPALTTA